MSGVCYACGSPAEHTCGMCGTAACSEHAERPSGFGTLCCGDCAHAMRLLRFRRRDDRS